MSNPLVSIVICTHNRERLLKRALQSAINQTYKNIEIIVSDDASSDGTKNLVNDFIEKHSNVRICYRRNQKSSGACYTRNMGIQMAKGEFITGLDDDDSFSEDRIQSFINSYDDNYSFICSNILVHKSKFKIFKLFKTQSVINLDKLLWYNFVGNQIFVKRERIVSVGAFDVNLSAAQDYDLWLRLVIKYGSCLRLSKATYNLHVDHEEPRITLSKNKINGMICFSNKYKTYMSRGQQKFHYLRRIFWEDKKRFSSLLLFNLSPHHISFIILYLRNRNFFNG